MTFFSPLKIAYRALKAHKVRSALTVLGLLIGVSSIIIVMNMGQGIKGFVLKQVEIFGSDFIQVEVKVPSTAKNSSANAMNMAQGVTITTMKTDDAEAVGKLPNIRGYYAGQMGQAILSRAGETKTAILWGVSETFFQLSKIKIASGREYTLEEDRSETRVVVLGNTLKEKLFGNDDVLGQWVKIGNKNFRVIGILEKQGTGSFYDMDSVAYLPLRTLQKQVMGVDYIMYFTVYMKDKNLAAQTAVNIEETMRARHKITDPKKDDFAVTTTEEAMGMINVITGGITLLLAAIAGISLLVGGVGIMNIMYVSVLERTYEIGLRKSVGATKSNILWQFLWEAIFLTFMGGLIGVIIGTLVSFGAFFAAKSFGFDFGLKFSWPGLILGVGFSVITGLIFGVYPARRAANLDPVEALRYE
ncbi:MAG: ABC-type antimicrobial peptide transport system, permease component [Candidatus Kuenenbacteria bacterium GW2011_GWA2_42_15]|nr:MAG: ABC-type antimicrobial peptide transport system, permease component [Candidatus Kuenenbacteria bacterium GW2011_GWA2_42_15]